MAILTDILNRYLGGGSATDQDFQHVAQNVPPDVLGKGITAALGSSQTPPAGELVGKMFNASSPEQRAAMLNQLSSALGPNAAAILGGILGPAAATSSAPITPQQASQITSQQVQTAVTQAEQKNPDILGNLGDFYAQHSSLVNTIGGAALAIALAKISEHVKG